ncbi:MAG: hypothetical protein ABIT96_08975, partial [Ferruginibacter sp.]
SNAPMKPFYDGAFKLAFVTRKKIIPCVIKGTREAMPIHKSFYLVPTKLSMTFMVPVAVSEKNVTPVKDEVFKKMVNVYEAKDV